MSSFTDIDGDTYEASASPMYIDLVRIDTNGDCDSMVTFRIEDAQEIIKLIQEAAK